MSIILDALKKMEGERAGKGPQARLSTSESPLPAGKRLLILSLAAAALALNLLAVVLWLGMRERPEERRAPESVHVPVAKSPAAAPRGTSPLAAPVSVVERPAPSLLPAGSASTPVPSPGFEGEEPSSLVVPLPAVEAPAAESRPTRAVGAPAAAPLLPPAARETPPRTEEAAADGVIAADQHEYDGSVLTVEELPENLRASVKDLKITAHVYSDDPAFRRVAVNDTLKREGDVVAGGLVVEDITEEGAILSYRGHLFKMESR